MRIYCKHNWMVLPYFIDCLQFYDTVDDIVLFRIRIASADDSQICQRLTHVCPEEKANPSRSVQMDFHVFHDPRDAEFRLVVRLHLQRSERQRLD